MATREQLIERILKVKELSEKGIDGEKENAKALLISLMDKYGFTNDDLNLKQLYFFKYSRFDKLSFKLLSQVIYSVLGKEKKNQTAKCHTRHSDIGYECTKEQAIEIEAKYTFYYEGLKQDMETLYNAFIIRNEIYSKDTEVTIVEEFTEEERKARELAESLDKKQFNKQLDK
jgi:hypothetical protein